MAQTPVTSNLHRFTSSRCPTQRATVLNKPARSWPEVATTLNGHCCQYTNRCRARSWVGTSSDEARRPIGPRNRQFAGEIGESYRLVDTPRDKVGAGFGDIGLTNAADQCEPKLGWSERG